MATESLRLGIVTATIDRERAEPCVQSWLQHARSAPALTVIENGSEGAYLGSVEAFRRGLDAHLHTYKDDEIIACLHDDLVILDADWDTTVREIFASDPTVGLVGFGGARQLGCGSIYQGEYRPEQLARLDYVSNLVDAEAHGARLTDVSEVACLDGFCQIGRRAFWLGLAEREWRTRELKRIGITRVWATLAQLGLVHHFSDSAVSCLARRLGWRVYYLPIRCRHLGGITAVGDPGYQRWAAEHSEGGDRGFWEAAQRIGYDAFKDVLPLRVG